MSKKHPSQPASAAPFGTETPKSRSVLVLLAVLCAGWFIFLLTLALRDHL